MAYGKPSNKLPFLLHNIQEERKAGSCSPLEELKDEVMKKKWCKGVFLEEMLNYIMKHT